MTRPPLPVIRLAAVTLYKYAKQLSDIGDCPPQTVAAERVTVYRFIRDDVSDPWNFLPHAIRDPGRTWPDNQRCDALSLSVFRSEPNAREFYRDQARRRKRIAQLLGTHLAKVPLEPEDGAMTPCRDDGHRSLHEYSTANLAAKAERIVEPLTAPDEVKP